MSIPAEQYYQAQQAVMGALLLDAPNVAGIIMHRTQSEDYTGVCRTIYDAGRRLFMAGRPIDPVTIRDQIGAEYGETLKQLMEITPTAANVDVYIDLMLEESKLSRLRGLFTGLEKVLTTEEAQKLLAQANRIMGGRPGIRVVTMEQGYLDFHERQKNPANLIRWGLERVDDTLKVEYGDFIILGGYPSAGKTAFSLQLAWNQSKTRRVGYFSLETKPEKLIDRTVAAVCGVDFGRIKEHSMNEDDWTACAYRSPAFVGRNLEIIQAGGLSVVDIQALALAGRYDIIYIDYLQLITPEDRRRSATEQVAQISKDLHIMTQTTGITVCALSQLSRPEKGGEQEKAPGLHSLRQSGQLEQDADGVMLLYKEEPNNPKSRRCLKIAKNKDGEAGGIAYLVFDGAHQRFKASVVDAPKKREPEYKKVSFKELPKWLPTPFEEDKHDSKPKESPPPAGGGDPPAAGNGAGGGSGAGDGTPGNGTGFGTGAKTGKKMPV